MSLQKFKNYDNIKTAIGQVRGEVFEQIDLDLIWIQGQPSSIGKTYYDPELHPYLGETFGQAGDSVELSVYDMDDNQLFWKVVPEPYEYLFKYDPTKLVLSPGDDLRAENIIRGQYRVLYEFYRDILGSRNGNKVYIEEISPSRREIRVLPVKVGSAVQNFEFEREFVAFGDNGTSQDEYISFFKSEVNAIIDANVVIPIGSWFNKARDSLNQNLISIKSKTNDLLEQAVRQSPYVRLTTKNQSQLAISIVKDVFVNLFGASYYQVGDYRYVELFWRHYIATIHAIDDISGNVDYYINLGNAETYPMVNWLRDDVKYSDSPYSCVIKLYKPLPKSVKPKQQLWIGRQITRPIIEKVFLFGQEYEVDIAINLTPNFDIEVGNLTGRSTGWETWDALVSTNVSTSQDLVDYYISQSSAGDIQLNIDYADYYNFIHFGSAEERLKNFHYKLELIDDYEEQIKKHRSVYSGSGGAYGSASIDTFQLKIRDVRSSFDGYEQHLYYTSGSQYSGSLLIGQYLTNEINEWPKQDDVYPFVLYELTSSVAESWYGDQLTIAQRFDRDNIHSFVNNIPAFISVQEDNEEYLTFLYMIGQHFDVIYTYINQLTNVANRDESLFEGMAKDLTYHVVRSMGFDAYSGNDNVDLWRWAFGYDANGSYHDNSVSGSNENWLSYGDVSKEIWRRILNNLPYLMKTKGTARSVKALLACYGIPTSILSIREYGGPDPRDYPEISRKSAYIFEDFVYSIDFEGSQSVTSVWDELYNSQFPNSLEFRFASAPTNPSASTNPSQSYGLGDYKPIQSLVATTEWSVNLINSGSGFGYIQFAISGTDNTGSSIQTEKYRYYDNEFNSVMLRYISGSTTSSDANFPFTNSIELMVKKSEENSDRIIFYSTAVLSASAEILNSFNTLSTLYIGGETAFDPIWGQNFTGSMQEFKLYQTALSESTFENHVRWPKAYNSNDPKQTYYDLVLRYSFDEPKNHSGGAPANIVSDVKANQTFTNQGTAVGFDDWINYTPRTEEYVALTPQAGGQININNKIRLEENERYFGDLAVDHRVEKASFDTAPNDSPKLGIYFTPLDAINRDIIGTYAGIDLAGEMADPRDRYEDHFRDLKTLNEFYWKKYTNRPNYNDFIRVIKQYDQSFFDHLKSLLPARAKPIIGVLIEPHILERNKIKWQEIGEERLDHDALLGAATEPTFSETYLLEETNLNMLMYDSQSEYLTWAGELSTGYENPSNYFRQNPVIVTSASLYTGDVSVQRTMGFKIGTYVGTGSLFIPGVQDEEQVISMIKPIQDTQTGSYDIRFVYNRISESFDTDTGYTYTQLAVYGTGSDGKPLPSKYYTVYDLKGINNWYYEHRELEGAIWYGGTLNTINTTLDDKEPVEISYTNPNKLKATDTGPSKVIVD